MTATEEEEKEKPTNIKIIVGEYKDSGVACPAVGIVIPPERYGWRYWITLPGLFKLLNLLLAIGSMVCIVPSCFATQPTYSHICKPKQLRMDADLNLYDENNPQKYEYCFSSLLFWYDKQLTIVKMIFWIAVTAVALLANLFIFIQQCRYTSFSVYYKRGLMRYYFIMYLMMDLSAACAIYNHHHYYQTNKIQLPHLYWVLPGSLCSYLNSYSHGLAFVWNFIRNRP